MDCCGVKRSCVHSAHEMHYSTNEQLLSLTMPPSVCPQVTQKAGRTSLSPETPTTWWGPTVFLCSSTTFKDGAAGVMSLNVEPWGVK